MAKVKLNPMFEQVSGQVGDLVFKRYYDEVIVARKPALGEIEPSEAQLAAREQFREAALYGKVAMADPDPLLMAVNEDSPHSRSLDPAPEWLHVPDSRDPP